MVGGFICQDGMLECRDCQVLLEIIHDIGGTVILACWKCRATVTIRDRAVLTKFSNEIDLHRQMAGRRA